MPFAANERFLFGLLSDTNWRVIIVFEYNNSSYISFIYCLILLAHKLYISTPPLPNLPLNS